MVQVTNGRGPRAAEAGAGGIVAPARRDGERRATTGLPRTHTAASRGDDFEAASRQYVRSRGRLETYFRHHHDPVWPRVRSGGHHCRRSLLHPQRNGSIYPA